jgi:hypothetical protein
MFIGDVFVAQGLATQDDVAAALELQRSKGGGLGDCLVELGTLEASDRDSVARAAPTAPHTVAETGVALPDLLNLLIKAMYVSGKETPSMMGDFLKLAPGIVHELIEAAHSRHLVSGLGAVSLHVASELRYELTDKGRQWAHDAMVQNQYVGPAPVPLSVFCEQIVRQRIVNEKVDRAAIDGAFADLVVSESLVTNIGPAINSGSSILLYGDPGNGKTTVSERVARLFTDVVYVPYCFEVDGQIVKVFDPGIHKPVGGRSDLPDQPATLHREDVDLRWEACWRPVIITGGELTLEMLDLSYNAEGRFYEAPLHIKALGGVFLIDDFGRQLVTPTALLNRWIVPMDNGVDYLKLHTGKSFSIPFDELVIFSTNLAPHDLMDAAFMRRIPYKIEICGPSAEEYRLIFSAASRSAGFEAPDQVVDYVIAELCQRNHFPLANYQPRFIVDQVRAACKFAGVAPEFQFQFVVTALNNMYTKDTPGYASGQDVAKAVSYARAA